MVTTRNVREWMESLMLFVIGEEGGVGMGDDDGRRQTCAAVAQSLCCLSWLHGFWDGGDTRPTA